MQVEHTYGALLPYFQFRLWIQRVSCSSSPAHICGKLKTQALTWGRMNIWAGHDRWSRVLLLSRLFTGKYLCQGKKENAISGKDMPLQIEQMYVK